MSTNNPPKLPSIDPSLPSANWVMRPLLTKKMFDGFRTKTLLISSTEGKIDTTAPDFPEICLALLMRAKEEGWLTAKDLKKHLFETLRGEILKDCLELTQEDIESDFLDIAKTAYKRVLAGALFANVSDKVGVLALVKEGCEGNFIHITDVRSEVARIDVPGRKACGLMDFPVTTEAYALYDEMLEIQDEDIARIVLSDMTPEFKMIMSLKSSLSDKNDLKDKVGAAALSQCPNIRNYLYDNQLSSLDEDVYGRMVGVFSALSESEFNLVESDIPEGFFDRYGHELWYEVIGQIDKSNLTVRNLTSADYQKGISNCLSCLSIMLRHGCSFYPALMAKTQGRNLVSLDRYRKIDQPSEEQALRALVAHISTKVYTVTDGELVTHGNGFAGQMLPYLLAKVVSKAYSAKLLESVLSMDSERIMFYRFTSKPLFLKNLEHRKLVDSLMGQDLGL